MKNDNVQILTEGKQVSHYIERVQALADSNKKILSFSRPITQPRGAMWFAVDQNHLFWYGFLDFVGFRVINVVRKNICDKESEAGGVYFGEMCA